MPNALKIIFLFSLLQVCFSLISKGQENILDTSINLNLKRKTAKESILLIEEKYKITFFYNDDLLDSTQYLNHNFKDLKLDKALKKIFRHSPIAFKATNNQVVLFYKEKPKQNFRVYGNISDKETGENMIGVTIYEPVSGMATISNQYGHFSITLPEGKHKLFFSFIGYKKKDSLINVYDNLHLNLSLAPRDVRLKEVTVTDDTQISLLKSTKVNTSAIYMREVQKLSGLLGENDVIRNLEILPGITQTDLSDGRVYVRGGNCDQTTFFMDGARIYTPAHFGNIFSVFNPDIVNAVEVYKGDMPVNDNGAISSAIKVHLKEGNNKKWKSKGSVGLISAKVLVEGPLIKDKSSVLVSFRRTYLDAILKSFNSSFNYNFYDLNLKYNIKLNNKNRLYFSAYSGTDNIIAIGSLKRGNQMINFRWNHIYASNAFSNTSVSFSRNALKIAGERFHINMGWKRRIYNMHLKHDMSIYLKKSVELKTGVSLTAFEIEPFVNTYNSKVKNSKISGTNEKLFISGSYVSLKANYKRKLFFNIGTRFNIHFNPNAQLHDKPGSIHPHDPLRNKETFTNLALEPRVSIKYLINPNIGMHIGYNRQINPLHQFQLLSDGVIFERWMPTTKGFKPEKSNNFVFGVFSELSNNINAEVEIYYRNMYNLYENLQNSDLMGTKNPDKFLAKAKGKARGIEFSIKHKTKRISSFINYCYSKTQWATNGVNNNHWYPAFHDRPHSISAAVNIKLTKRTSLSTSWLYSSGLPYTKVKGKYILDGKKMVSFHTKNINSERMPDYHRMDISIDLIGKKNHLRRWKNFWNFSIYNVYFQKNPYAIVYFTAVDDESTDAQFEFNPKYSFFYQFIPSVTYRFEF